jgi:hypothetical protein
VPGNQGDGDLIPALGFPALGFPALGFPALGFPASPGPVRLVDVAYRLEEGL